MRGSLFSLAGGLPDDIAEWLTSSPPPPCLRPARLCCCPPHFWGSLLPWAPASCLSAPSCSPLLAGSFFILPLRGILYFWPSFRKAWETASWSERREGSGQRRRGGRCRGKHADVQITTPSCPKRSHSLCTALCDPASPRDGFLWRSCPQLPLSDI